MKKFILSAAVVPLFSFAAYAADLPNTKGPPAFAPPPPPAFAWTGFYVGINGGWIGSMDDGITNTGTDTGAAGVGSALAAGGIPRSISLSSDGGLVGGTAGYNWQFNSSFVAGFEGDIDWVDAGRSASVGPITALGFRPLTTYASRSLDWLGTLRGRIGFTPTDPVLIYATGGLAVGEPSLGIGAVSTGGAPPLNAFSTTATLKVGWTIGGGVEWKFAPQLSVKAEYLYADLGYVNSTINYAYGANTSSLTAHIRETYSIARVGLNYTFGEPPPPAPPIAAKY